VSPQSQISKARRVRRLALTVAVAAVSCSSSGCQSAGGLQSLNPLAKKPDATITASTPASETGVTAAISNFAQGTRNQASSMGMAVKSAYSKSVDSVSGVFGGKASATDVATGQPISSEDPLLLTDKPTSVGPEVFVANGQLWESTGNFDRAMDNYSKALEKEPNNSPALASIARLHYRQEQYDKSVEFFQRAIAASPKEAGLQNDLGLTLSQIGRHDEAVSALNQAITLAPGTSRYANNLATVQFQAGREDEARATLLKHNTKAVAHYNMAYLQHSSQRNDKALQELGQVLAISETADTDSASQRAISKSKELFEKLGGPATAIAQSLPHLYGGVKDSSQAVGQVASSATEAMTNVRANAEGFAAKLSDVVKPLAGTASPVATTPTSPSQTNQFAVPTLPAPAIAATPTAPPATVPPATFGGFVLPDYSPGGTNGAVPPVVAETPTSSGITR
jgi:hypothetical protein